MYILWPVVWVKKRNEAGKGRQIKYQMGINVDDEDDDEDGEGDDDDEYVLVSSLPRSTHLILLHLSSSRLFFLPGFSW